MKSKIHPKYHLIKVQLTDGSQFETKSTWGKPDDTMTLEVDTLTHPAWTGGKQFLMKAGQLDRYRKRFKNFSAKS